MKKLIFFIVFALLFGAAKAQTFDSITSTSNGQFCLSGGTLTFTAYCTLPGGPLPLLELKIDDFCSLERTDTITSSVTTFTTAALTDCDAGTFSFELWSNGVFVSSKTVTLSPIQVTAGTVSNPYGYAARICLFQGSVTFSDSGTITSPGAGHFYQYWIGGGVVPTDVVRTLSDSISIVIDRGPVTIEVQRIDTAVCPTGGTAYAASNKDSIFIDAPESNRLDSINSTTISLHFPTSSPRIRYLWIKDGIPFSSSFGAFDSLFLTGLSPGAWYVEIEDTGTGCKRYTDTIYLLVSPSALPITLKDFKASSNNGTVELSWSTYTETNNAKFELLKFDGEDFKTFASVSGAGNSRDIRNYVFIDDSPLIGIGYYRLKQVDFDGASTLSGIVSVETSSGGPTWTMEGRIISAKGRILIRNLSAAVVVSGKDQVSLEGLAPGGYVLTVNGKSQKIVMQ